MKAGNRVASLGVLPLVIAPVTFVVLTANACTGGGGSGSSGTPANRCADFLALTSDCSARGGRPIPNNSAACSEAALDDRTLAQVDCALASPDAYCRSLIAAFSRDASAISPNDPELIKLNACSAAKITASPCKEAIQVLAECGAGIGFAPDCSSQSAVLAKCVVDNPVGACATYRPRQAGTALPPEAQKFQQCQIDGSRALLDAGSR
jgi:hypothetical protein